MTKILTKRRKQREQAIQLALSYLDRLEDLLSKRDIENPSILTAVLYGSYARGDFHQGSDIDLLLIVESLPADPLRRLDLLYECVKGKLEPKAYTRKEFLDMIRSRNPMALDALTNGVLLLDRGFWEQSQGTLKSKVQVSGTRHQFYF